MDFTGFYWVLLDFFWFLPSLLLWDIRFSGFYCFFYLILPVLPGFTEFYLSSKSQTSCSFYILVQPFVRAL